jgi:hypothetical protein
MFMITFLYSKRFHAVYTTFSLRRKEGRAAFLRGGILNRNALAIWYGIHYNTGRMIHRRGGGPEGAAAELPYCENSTAKGESA